MDDYNKIQNDKTEETLIKIEVLQKEYEVTLQQYQEALQNYISSLENTHSITNSNSNNQDESQFTSLKGRTWWGTQGLKEGTVSNESECISMCASDDKCSGATFNPVKRYCWTRSGDSSITTGLDTDNALVKKQTLAISVMKVFNDKLLNLNKEIADTLLKIKPQIKEQMEEKNRKQEELNKSYQQLLEQKTEIEKQKQEYNSINKYNQNQLLFTDQENISNRFWVLITFLVLLFTFNKMFNLPTPSFSFLIWIFIISAFITLTFNMTTSGGFFMCFAVFIIIILMKTGNLLSP
jgi:hypothetical protein